MTDHFKKGIITPKLISMPEWFKDQSVEEYPGNILHYLHNH